MASQHAGDPASKGADDNPPNNAHGVVPLLPDVTGSFQGSLNGHFRPRHKVYQRLSPLPSNSKQLASRLREGREKPGEGRNHCAYRWGMADHQRGCIAAQSKSANDSQLDSGGPTAGHQLRRPDGLAGESGKTAWLPSQATGREPAADERGDDAESRGVVTGAY